MAVIDRRLAAIDYPYRRETAPIPSASDRGHASGASESGTSVADEARQIQRDRHRGLADLAVRSTGTPCRAGR